MPSEPTVHWLGTGLSTGRGLRALDGRLTLWGRDEAKARRCAERLGLQRASTAGYSPDALAAQVAPGDVVVSMLPASEHLPVIALALAHGAHFACSSYTTPELAALGRRAQDDGLAVLTEAGLDPGLDHLVAHALIACAHDAIGGGPARAEFTSYCGGMPAVPNDFRYRFSWAPRGVLTALLNPACFVENGTVREAARPWEATRTHIVEGEEFEAYPNRDSTPFIEQYALPAEWEVTTFLRGTLRLPGWRTAWAGVFDALAGGGLPVIDELAAELAARHPYTAGDLDRVVLAVELTVDAGARGWSGCCVLDAVGTAEETAMARLVTTPLVVGVEHILAGTVPAGLNRAAETPAAARQWLADLADRGILVGIHGNLRGAVA